MGGSIAASFPWKGYEEILKQRVKGLFDSAKGLVTYKGTNPVWKTMQKTQEVTPDYKSFDEMWNKLKSGGLWFRPAHSYGRWDTIFKTATGKFEFLSSRLQLAVQSYLRQNQADIALAGMGIGAGADAACLPHYEEVKQAFNAKDYPLTMVPYEIINIASGWIASPPHLNKTIFDDQLLKEDSFAEINPKTASQLGLKEGDLVFIESPAGRIQVRINLFDGAMPGAVFVPLGFGHIGYDEFTKGKGANPNYIISPQMDPLSGQPVWWKTPVKIIKV
jgi:anaerobic selenocysteine-containing dehydrogenase